MTRWLYRYGWAVPVLAAVAPILQTYAENRYLVSFTEALVPMAISGGVMAVLVAAARWIGRRPLYSDAILTLLALWFYSIEPFTESLPATVTIRHHHLDLHLWLVPVSLAALVALIVILWKRAVLPKVLVFGALVSLVMIVIGAAQLASGHRTGKTASAIQPQSLPTATKHPDDPPDVWYILLDGYAGQQSLKEVMGYDNGPFMDWLRQKGFIIPATSVSNYPHTFGSYTSSLNFSYLDELPITDQDKHEYLSRFMTNNRAGQFLKGQGYKYVHFSSGFPSTDTSPIADITFKRESELTLAGHKASVSPFDSLVVGTTALAPFVPSKLIDDYPSVAEHEFDSIPQAASIPGPKFVNIHIVSPHPPIAFDARGNRLPKEISTWTPTSKYVDQLKYVTDRTKTAIDQILANSSRPPVIILQSDHGSPSLDGDKYWAHARPDDAVIRERTNILNAYYLPGAPAGTVPDLMTPVNTFPMIFNTYFGTNLPFKPNRAYYMTSGLSFPSDFTFNDVTGVVLPTPAGQ